MAEMLKRENEFKKELINYFKKLLFTMENATAAGSSQSNISRIYIWKDKTDFDKEVIKRLIR